MQASAPAGADVTRQYVLVVHAVRGRERVVRGLASSRKGRNRRGATDSQAMTRRVAAFLIARRKSKLNAAGGGGTRSMLKHGADDGGAMRRGSNVKNSTTTALPPTFTAHQPKRCARHTPTGMTPQPETHNFTPIPLNSADPDAWDDSALIAAFDSAVASHRTADGGPRDAPTSMRVSNANMTMTPPRKRRLSALRKPEPKRQAGVHVPPHATNHAALSPHAAAAMIPPPPPGAGGSGPDSELAGLLAAWYEAGYRAGAY
eukprot:IDg10903t1